jgi:GNAT superfamily N-acetyltransferase
VDVRPATPADAATIGDLFAAAFHDDPWLAWTFPDATARPRQLARFMAALVAEAVPAGWVFIGAGGATATLWHPPEGIGSGDAAAFERFMRSLVGDHAAAVLAAAADVAALRARHRPHFYLSVVGTHPSRQGEGLGRRLLADNLARIAATGIPAYLESTNPANRPFYAGLGFASVGTVTAPGGPTLTAMAAGAVSSPAMAEPRESSDAGGAAR